MTDNGPLAIRAHQVHITLSFDRFWSICVFEDLDSGRFYLPPFKGPRTRRDPEASAARMLEAIINHEDLTSYPSLDAAVSELSQTVAELS